MRRRILILTISCLVVVLLYLSHLIFVQYSRQQSVNAQPATQSTVKIFMTFYKPYRLPKRGVVLQPIQVGRAIENEPFMGGQLSDKDKEWFHQNMIGDDTGDNISAKNRSFDVLTAYYWVWKHYEEIGNPKYIGFFAHKKGLNFDFKPYVQYNAYAPDYGIVEKDLLEILEKHKVITMAWTPYIYKDGKKFLTSAYENYLDYHNIDDLKEMIQVIEEKYPAMNKAMNEVLYEIKPLPIWNYFVMEKALAFDYFEKLFDVMFELDKRIGEAVNQRDYSQRRAFGYLAERFFAMWLTWQQEQGKVQPYLTNEIYY